MDNIEKCDSISCTCNIESKPMQIKDSMGREIFWEDLGRPDGQ
jgi:hypothetical protein